ncbi:MAG: Ku protein [Deltaproteobacteria bacterium HGW-Deltaproteobacteria-15]|jgi:DNA end-binding protein Ku|nr:MAG: Ku protein [Deltaproteobacteria bacterium HGW-Deltaproteobacteria-15]
MARPIWKGHITFGLVNIPVTLYSAEKRDELHFKLLDSRNKARVHYERVNEETGEEVPWSEVVKAFEYDKGNYVLVEEEDFKRAAPEATQAVEIQDFVDREDVDYVYYDKPYYLMPGKKGEKGYVLLREILRRTGKVGISKVVIRTRQYLAALLAEGDALVLELLRFDQEVRKPEEFDLPQSDLKEYQISEREVEMGIKLVENMTSDWTPEKYKDDYREALMNWIDEKAKKGEQFAPEAPPEEERVTADVINLMDVLKRSVERTEKEKKAKDQGARMAHTAKAKGQRSKRMEHRAQDA